MAPFSCLVALLFILDRIYVYYLSCFIYAKRVELFFMFIIISNSFIISVISYDNVLHVLWIYSQIHYSKFVTYIRSYVHFQFTAINVNSWKSFFICFTLYTPDWSTNPHEDLCWRFWMVSWRWINQSCAGLASYTLTTICGAVQNARHLSLLPLKGNPPAPFFPHPPEFFSWWIVHYSLPELPP